MLSVVIATHNSERQLVPVLSALVPGVTAGVLRDVALVDNGSTDDTAAIADAAGCTFLHTVSDVGVRLKQGAAQSRGRWLLFLAPQSLLEEGWVREVANFIETAERRGQSERVAATFRLAVDGYGLRPRLGEAMAAARLALLGLPQPPQGLLISRKHYERLGGHPAGVRAERRLASRIGRRRIHLLRTHVLLPDPT
ncbi:MULTISPECIES: glycosyltransferase [unclassified Xanthobacter]|uniref:glycosyltransferase n=1 Tax=unclassified Xanthobacter TaxID=2623496 RepID=UPI001EE0EEE4|nr:MULTISPECIES: glycosyltransferase [unclassified Xanthobacter]